MSQPNALERLMLELINEERANAGLDPLRINGDLNEASEDHSEWMLDTDTFSHTGQAGSSAGDRIVEAGYRLEGNWTWGENIAWQSERGAQGLEDDVRNLHESLMNSPGHRANILNDNFEEIGIGIERGDFDNFDSVMVTQNFGTTDATSTPDPVTPPAPEPSTPPEPEPPLVVDVPTVPTQPEPPAPTPPQPPAPGPVIPVIQPDGPPPWDPLGTGRYSDTFEFTPFDVSLFDTLADLLGLQPAPQPVPDVPVTPEPTNEPLTFFTIGFYDWMDFGS